MGFNYDMKERKQLIYEFEDSNQFDADQLGGLLSLELKEVLPLQKRFRDGITNIYYDINSWYSLEEYIQLMSRKGEFGANDIGNILVKVIKIAKNMEQYFFLNANNLAISESTIFIDLRSQEVKCVYVPTKDHFNSLEKSIKQLVDFMARKAAHSDEVILFVHKLSKFIDEEMDSLDSLQSKIQSLGLKNKSVSQNEAPKPVNTPKKETPVKMPPKDDIPIKKSVKRDVKQTPINKESKSKQPLNKPQKGKVEKTPKNMMQTEKKTIDKSNKMNIILGQILIGIVIAIIASSGVLNDDSGNLNITNLIVVSVMVVCAGEYLVLKLFYKKTETVDKKVKQEKKKSKNQANKKSKNAKKVNHPANQVQPKAQKPAMDKINYQSNNAQQVVAQGTVIINQDKDNSSDRTVMLSQEKTPVIMIKANHQWVKKPILSTPFLIGRDSKFCDLVINNPAVSSIHVHIEEKDGDYILVDKESKNGTYINGVRIESNVFYKISAGEKIKLANEEIIFDNN